MGLQGPQAELREGRAIAPAISSSLAQVTTKGRLSLSLLLKKNSFLLSHLADLFWRAKTITFNVFCLFVCLYVYMFLFMLGCTYVCTVCVSCYMLGVFHNHYHLHFLRHVCQRIWNFLIQLH